MKCAHERREKTIRTSCVWAWINVLLFAPFHPAAIIVSEPKKICLIKCWNVHDGAFFFFWNHRRTSYAPKPKSKRSRRQLSATCNNLLRPFFLGHLLHKRFRANFPAQCRLKGARLCAFGFDFLAAVVFFSERIEEGKSHWKWNAPIKE